MDQDTPKEERAARADVLVFRNNTGDPIAVPDEVVTAAERAYRCYQARVGGTSWEQIAAEEGYPSGEAAKYDVDRYMEEAKSLVVEASARDMLTMEVVRLDALQRAIWPMAMKGHVQSASLAMNIILNRAKLVGLDPDKMAEQAEAARTVVVPHQEDAYIAALQQASKPKAGS